MTSNGNTDLARIDTSACGLDACHHITLANDPCDFAVLNDINTARICGSGVTPGNRVVTRCATTGLD